MLEGHPTWPFLNYQIFYSNMQQKIKVFFMQEFLLKKNTFYWNIFRLINHLIKKVILTRF